MLKKLVFHHWVVERTYTMSPKVEFHIHKCHAVRIQCPASRAEFNKGLNIITCIRSHEKAIFRPFFSTLPNLWLHPTRRNFYRSSLVWKASQRKRWRPPSKVVKMQMQQSSKKIASCLETAEKPDESTSLRNDTWKLCSRENRESDSSIRKYVYERRKGKYFGEQVFRFGRV